MSKAWFPLSAGVRLSFFAIAPVFIGCVPVPESKIRGLESFLGPPAGTTVVMRTSYDDQDNYMEWRIRAEATDAVGVLSVQEQYVDTGTNDVLGHSSYQLRVTSDGLIQTGANGKQAVLLAASADVAKSGWPGIARLRAASPAAVAQGSVSRVESTCEVAEEANVQTLGVVRRTITVRCTSAAGAKPSFTRLLAYAAGLGLVGVTHTERGTDGQSFVAERWVLARVE